MNSAAVATQMWRWRRAQKPVTRVLWNGWAGPLKKHRISHLLDLLKREPLDPLFEQYGNFMYNAEGEVDYVRFFGNFYNYSNAFALVTNDPNVIAMLGTAIAANKQTAAYKQARDERALELARRRRERLESERRRLQR